MEGNLTAKWCNAKQDTFIHILKQDYVLFSFFTV